ncbi:MAG: hypothetical protein OXI30_15855 [Chloroflexota bacterium]|nr:hypothetical protein [Chloroflexota bacterium]
MPNTKQPSDPKAKADQLARIVELLRLEINEEDLEALSNQLYLMDALEESALHDYAPVLRMDAAWHD